MKTICEPVRDVPVVREVDVLVAGGGVAGVFAALTAAKEGVKVLLVDRFGMLGGNMGAPGNIIGGGTGLHSAPTERQFSRSAPTVVEEFLSRAEETLGDLPRHFPEIAQAYSRVATAMARELGVELMLSAYAGAPIMDGDTVRGLFVETKSGRVAVLAKVTIDGTGDAGIAARAGAPMIVAETAEEMISPNMPQWTVNPRYAHYNEGGIYCLMSGVDIAKFREWANAADAPPLSAEEKSWFEAKHRMDYNPFWKDDGWPARMVSIFHRGSKSGEFTHTREIRPKLVTDLTCWFDQLAPNVACGRAMVYGEYDSGSWEDISLAEAGLRAHVYDGVRFLRKHAPGFEQASLIAMAPFLGARGGPHIEGEFVLRPQESFAGFDHPQTMYRSYTETFRKGSEAGHDVPYGMIVPKKVDGLLVTGRSASWLRRGHDPSFRARGNMMHFGQATGAAAAMAVQEGIAPRQLDVARLRRKLYAAGFVMGGPQRLKQLGLV